MSASKYTIATPSFEEAIKRHPTLYTVGFDLEQFVSGVKAVTREGVPVTYIAICHGCNEHNKLITHSKGAQATTNYSLSGKYMFNPFMPEYEDELDLIAMYHSTV